MLATNIHAPTNVANNVTDGVILQRGKWIVQVVQCKSLSTRKMKAFQYCHEPGNSRTRLIKSQAVLHQVEESPLSSDSKPSTPKRVFPFGKGRSEGDKSMKHLVSF